MRLLLLVRAQGARARSLCGLNRGKGAGTRRQAIIGALLLIGVGVVLGATVFRTDIAQATGLAQSVTVANTADNPVPVREQNLDGGNIRVHEQGTVQVADSESPGRTAVYYQEGITSVPAGHRVIVTYVSASANQFTGAAGVRCLLERSGGGVTEILASL